MFDWDEKPDLNITPLVDVMLVLMAILMVTAPVFVYEEKITLPEGSKLVRQESDKKIEILLSLQRQATIDGQTVPLENFAPLFASKTVRADRENPVVIKADAKLAYEDVMTLLALVKQNGFTKVSLATHG